MCWVQVMIKLLNTSIVFVHLMMLICTIIMSVWIHLLATLSTDASNSVTQFMSTIDIDFMRVAYLHRWPPLSFFI